MLYSVVQSLYSVTCTQCVFNALQKKANCFHGMSKYHKVYIVEKKLYISDRIMLFFVCNKTKISAYKRKEEEAEEKNNAMSSGVSQILIKLGNKVILFISENEPYRLFIHLNVFVNGERKENK